MNLSLRIKFNFFASLLVLQDLTGSTAFQKVFFKGPPDYVKCTY